MVAGHDVMSTFVRFKLSCHELGIELGRWKDRKPRRDRVCTLCDCGALDDEMHMVYECPALEPVRDQFPHFFEGSQDMRRLFAHKDQTSLVRFVHRCFRLREQMQSDKP